MKTNDNKEALKAEAYFRFCAEYLELAKVKKNSKSVADKIPVSIQALLYTPLQKSI